MITQEELLSKIDSLRDEVVKLYKENEELRVSIGITDADKAEDWKYKNAYPFTIKVEDMDINIRLRNRLLWKYDWGGMDVRTVGEIVSLPREAYRRCRGMGHKSLTELENWLARYGLTFGMWNDPDRDYDKY